MNSWNSPIGLGVFFAGLGLFFLGLSHLQKLYYRSKGD